MQDQTTALQNIDAARLYLAEARKLSDVISIRDKAMAMAAYAEAQGASDAAQMAKELQLRAERKAGAFLADMDKNEGNRFESCADGGNKTLPPPKLADIGIEKMQSSRWQAEASVPEERFETWVAETKAAGRELTAGELQRVAQALRREKTIEKSPPFPTGHYAVIYADPAWAYDNSGLDQSAESHYPTMSTEAICALPVAICCTNDTVLFLWITSPLLPEAFRVIDAWGFTYKASIIWDKEQAPGIGWFVQTQHELLLIATRAGNPHPTQRPVSVVRAERGRHSQKPEAFYDIIESMYAGPYCELFARNVRPGWEAWGNEL